MILDSRYTIGKKLLRIIAFLILLQIGAFKTFCQDILIAPAKKSGTWGYIDKSGNWIVSPQFLAAKKFDHNLGEVIYYEPEVDDYRTKFITIKNETSFRLPELNYSEFSEGHLAYKEGNLYGFIDSTGTKVIPAQFKFCSPFRSGKAAVMFKSGKMGYINYAKQLLISPRYDTAFDFRDKFAVVGKKDIISREWKYGVIDQYGNILVPFIYDWITNFSEGKAFGNKGGVIERNLLKGGQWVIINLADEIISDLSDTTLYVSVDNSKSQPWLEFHEGVAWFPGKVNEKQLFGLIDSNGKWILSPKYQVVSSISEGLAGVFDNKMGYVNLTGKLVVPCLFDVVSDFHYGMAKVKIGQNYGFIDKNGKLVIPAELEDAGDFVMIK